MRQCIDLLAAFYKLVLIHTYIYIYIYTRYYYMSAGACVCAYACSMEVVATDSIYTSCIYSTVCSVYTCHLSSYISLSISLAFCLCVCVFCFPFLICVSVSFYCVFQSLQSAYISICTPGHFLLCVWFFFVFSLFHHCLALKHCHTVELKRISWLPSFILRRQEFRFRFLLRSLIRYESYQLYGKFVIIAR